MTASAAAFGWHCVRCGAIGESSHRIGSQSDLEVHWLARHGLPMPEAPQFRLTPEETVTVLDWYYSASDDFIPDDRDRDLANRLANFAHLHKMEGYA